MIASLLDDTVRIALPVLIGAGAVLLGLGAIAGLFGGFLIVSALCAGDEHDSEDHLDDLPPRSPRTPSPLEHPPVRPGAAASPDRTFMPPPIDLSSPLPHPHTPEP